MPELETINFDKRPTLEQLREMVPYGASLSPFHVRYRSCSLAHR